jgi:apocytochrome f
MVFPILSPDPAKDKDVYFLKYPIFVGGNRGRGQVYPTGEKSNNTIYSTGTAGTVQSIEVSKKFTDIVIQKADGTTITEKIPAGPEVIVAQGQVLKADQPLTNNPNVGGFGQTETEVVLQDPSRVKALLVFFAFTIIGQVFLVLKKKQYEKVQLAEMNF